MTRRIDFFRSRQLGAPICLLLTWVLCSWLTASAQTRPSISLRWSAGQPALTLRGDPGAVYSIQDSDVLLPRFGWTDRANLEMRSATESWTDPAPVGAGQRFYRAVVFVPADTNLVFVQHGAFVMGSPDTEALRFTDESQHQVTITRGFWIHRYLVRQKDYLAVMGKNPSQFIGDLNRPVERVTWYDATNYCAMRTQQEQAAGLISSNLVYRLPTEAEWEYACRAGRTTAFYLGSGLYSGQANFDGQYGYDSVTGAIFDPTGIFLQKTTAVGMYPANLWGLYDMIGNVMEWCQDWYGDYPTGSLVDPQGPATGTLRVRRGGYWLLSAQYCRSAQRAKGYGTEAAPYYGFRVVLSIL